MIRRRRCLVCGCKSRAVERFEPPLRAKILLAGRRQFDYFRCSDYGPCEAMANRNRAAV